MQLPDWPRAFEEACQRSEGTLDWGLPEQWVHAELFRALRKRSETTGWEPFSTELPYLTYYPVSLPKSTHRDWRQDGAIKWVDLCLYNATENAWCWFELKVRHAGHGSRRDSSAAAALDAVVKDYVGLCGFDAASTSAIWTEPDQLTKAYWFDELLLPYADRLENATHHFTSAFLQIANEIDPDILSDSGVQARIRTWVQWRSKQSDHHVVIPETTVTRHSSLSGGHSLLICQSCNSLESARHF